jgi:hypothetical protein
MAQSNDDRDAPVELMHNFGRLPRDPLCDTLKRLERSEEAEIAEIVRREISKKPQRHPNSN